MIIECPNCFLEQPLDQYCAGCGKQLNKLLEEKNQKNTTRSKKINYAIAAIIISFLTGSVVYYSLSSSKNNLLTSRSDRDTVAKVKLPKTKIIGDKKAFKLFKDYAVEDVKPKRVKKTIVKKMKPAASLLSASAKKVKKDKIKKVYFISLENCNDTFPVGELTVKQQTEILECGNIHFKTSRPSAEVILDNSPSFATQATLSIQEYLIELNFSLTTDLYIEEFKQTLTLPLDVEPKFVATLWVNTGHDIESEEPPGSDMLSSYATSALFNFVGSTEAPPKLYFLASYNKKAIKNN